MFGFPYITCCGVDNRTLWIAVAVAVDGFNGPGSVYERIIGRDSSIVVNAVYLSVCIVESLRKIEMLTAFTYPKKQIALSIECKLASPVMSAIGGRGFLF